MNHALNMMTWQVGVKPMAKKAWYLYWLSYYNSYIIFDTMECSNGALKEISNFVEQYYKRKEALQQMNQL